ncbi:hypothetical protein ACXO8U_03220 [Lactobacillus delbrueckii subsp. bulgaricus]|nr:hypothetical protein [Lactobacillus delbrueckii subsp. bulgaricus]
MQTKKPTLAGLEGYAMNDNHKGNVENRMLGNDNHKGNVENRNAGTKKVTRTTDRKRPPSK